MNFKNLTIQDAVAQIPQIIIYCEDEDYTENGTLFYRYHRVDHLTECKDFNIECELMVSENYSYTSRSYQNPSEITKDNEDIWVNNFRVIDEDSNELQDEAMLDEIYRQFLKNILAE